MVELVARFEDAFKALNYNKETVCELFKRLQDLVISRASDLQQELKNKVVDLAEHERTIVKVLSSPQVWLTPEQELKFYAKAYTLIVEAIKDLESEYFWLVRSGMGELAKWCRDNSE